MPLTPAQLSTLADELCTLVPKLTAHRVGSGPHWLSIGDLLEHFENHRVPVSAEDLDKAIDLAVERCTLRVDPLRTSISAWQKDWKIRRRE